MTTPTGPTTHGTAGTGAGGTGQGSPSAVPSTHPSSGTPLRHNDYSVTAIQNCHWIMDAATHLSLSSEYTIAYQSLIPAVQVPWALANSRNTLRVETRKPPQLLPVTFTVTMTDTQTFANSAWPGTTVDLIMRIYPQTEDTYAGDDAITVRIDVPSSPPGTDLLNPIPCTIR